jgi:hypothetical protein
MIQTPFSDLKFPLFHWDFKVKPVLGNVTPMRLAGPHFRQIL